MSYAPRHRTLLGPVGDEAWEHAWGQKLQDLDGIKKMVMSMYDPICMRAAELYIGASHTPYS